MTHSKNGLKWLGPVLSVAVACVLFANCTSEERDFDSARNPGGDSDAGADAAADAGDAGNFTADDCVGQDDGEGCGEMSGFICVNESCRESSCGDGYVNADSDEECDDGNTDPTDGCEPLTCAFTCETNAECDDGDPCNGEETCDMGRNMCQTGDAPDTTEQVPCTLPLPPAMDAGAPVDSGAGDGGMSDASGPILTDASAVDGSVDASGVDAGPPVDPSVGFCKAGLCVPAGCGNGLLQAGEDCDDLNLDNTDGCKSDCTFTCEQDGDCDDLSVCTGTETCDTDTHTCVSGDDALDCEDDNDCTRNDCDAATGCLNSLIDPDGDGHASTEIGNCGDDCDETDETIFEGAPELCDGKDNDCDVPENVDEAAPFWYQDNDGDSYAQQGAASVQGCEAPAETGWTTRIPINGDLSTIDCFDTNAAVHPNRDPDPYSTTAVPGKAMPLEFDWNCNNTEDRQYATAVPADSYCGGFIPVEPAPGLIFIPLCFGNAGYASPPACGVGGTYTYCSSASGSCQRETSYDYPQPCR
jgi:cysteine-rich repeat protein